eukprot:1195901-Prorocentrum_minimum.AAC.3
MPLLCEEKGYTQPIAVAAKYEDVRAKRASRMEVRHARRKEPRRKGLVPCADSRPYCMEFDGCSEREWKCDQE